MFESIELVSMGAFLIVFATTWGLFYFVFWRVYGDEARALARLRDLSAEKKTRASNGLGSWAQITFPRIGTLAEIVLPQPEAQVDGLRSQFVRAGLYHVIHVRIFLGVKLALMLTLSISLALAPFLLGLLTLGWAMIASVIASAAGLLAPNLWLRYRISCRQALLRRGLPDCLDMLVLSLEGGISLRAALPRVVAEMLQVHPALGGELTIVQQTANLGLSVGDALKQFGERCGISEIKDLAAVILQSERFGASLVKTLRTHADSFRLERQQQAEEMAQKASVKILFPMLFFIFPAVFIVLLGPAAFQMAQLFTK